MATTGDNDNDGTEGLPFLTVQYGLDQLNPGDSLIIRDGIYNEALSWTSSGTVNNESPLLMQVDSVGEETVLSAIVRLLDRAQMEKPGIARLADRVAGWFVAGLLVLATALCV